jgi:hypothetical protein
MRVVLHFERTIEKVITSGPKSERKQILNENYQQSPELWNDSILADGRWQYLI